MATRCDGLWGKGAFGTIAKLNRLVAYSMHILPLDRLLELLILHSMASLCEPRQGIGNENGCISASYRSETGPTSLGKEPPFD